GLMHTVANHARWGEHRGGMFVEASGGGGIRSWHMVAEGDEGPWNPTFACAAVLKALAAGAGPAAGARSASGELELADFEPFFAAHGFVHGVRDEAADPGQGVFRIALGEAFGRLPPTVRALHADGGDQSFEGMSAIERGRGPLAALVCALIGF